jgi:HSP20 family protein
MRNTIIVRDPFREFDTLVRRSFGQEGGPAAAATAVVGFVPSAQSHREGDDAVVKLDLPGVDVDNDVTVEVVDRSLVINGERRDARDESVEAGRFREVRYGTFRRAFRLPGAVDTDQVSASYDAGVLTVRVAGVYAEPEGRRITITTGIAGIAGTTGIAGTEGTEG